MCYPWCQAATCLWLTYSNYWTDVVIVFSIYESLVIKSAFNTTKLENQHIAAWSNSYSRLVHNTTTRSVICSMSCSRTIFCIGGAAILNDKIKQTLVVWYKFYDRDGEVKLYCIPDTAHTFVKSSSCDQINTSPKTEVSRSLPSLK